MKTTSTNADTLQSPKRKRREKIATATSGRTGGDEIETQKAVTPIPAFSLRSRVKAETGFFDHLEVSSKHGYVTGTHEEIDLFRLYTGAAPQHFKAEDTSEMYGRLFNAAPENGRGKLPLSVRKTLSQWGGEPLPAPPFSGKIRTRRRRAGDQFICEITSELHLNPTQALNLSPSLAGKAPPSWQTVLLSRRPDKDFSKGLDGKLNVIPSDMVLRARRNGAHERYMMAVFDGIDSEFVRASAATDTMPMEGSLRTEDFSLRRVETYWEFSAPDAVDLVKRLLPALRAFHKHSREREHGADFETTGNAPTVTLFLSNGEAIRIYAKTADRIRFEVIHLPKVQNGLIPGGYCASTRKELVQKLHFLRKRSAQRINQILAFLSEWAEETPQDRASATRFASVWFQTLGFSDSSENLLNLLKVNGRIVSGPCLPRADRNALRRAQEQRLVFYDEPARAYYPASLGTALPISGHSLTHEDSDHTNLGHNTETHPVVSVPKSHTPIRKGREVNQIPPSPPLAFLRSFHRQSSHQLVGL